MNEIQVRHVGEAEWPDLERLFGRAGADSGCWCQYWLLGADYHRRDSAENRDALRGEVSAGDAGLLAYRDGVPIGWARLTPRSRLSWLTRRFSALTADDDAHPWSLPCFFVARSARGTGVMTALIRFAAQWADAHEVLLEGYPIDPDAPGATRNRFSGVLSAFTGAGFEPTVRLAKDRMLVRRPATRGAR